MARSSSITALVSSLNPLNDEESARIPSLDGMKGGDGDTPQIELMNFNIKFETHGAGAVAGDGNADPVINIVEYATEKLQKSNNREWLDLQSRFNLVIGGNHKDNHEGDISVEIAPHTMQKKTDGWMIYFTNKTNIKKKHRDFNEYTLGFHMFSNGSARIFTGISDIDLVPRMCSLFKLVTEIINGSTTILSVNPILIKATYMIPPPYKTMEAIRSCVFVPGGGVSVDGLTIKATWRNQPNKTSLRVLKSESDEGGADEEEPKINELQMDFLMINEEKDGEDTERKTKRARKEADAEAEAEAEHKKMKCIINVKGSTGNWMVNKFPSIRKAMFSIAQASA
jgi:hypothetical protein